MTEQRTTWRVGQHYGIHVYEVDQTRTDDRPVATFHTVADAAIAVERYNAVPGLVAAHAKLDAIHAECVEVVPGNAGAAVLARRIEAILGQEDQ